MPRAALVPPGLAGRPFTLAEGLAAGLTRRQLRSSVWRRLRSGLYVLGSVELTLEARVAAVLKTLELPHEPVVSGFHAAALRGIDVDPGDRVEITLPDTASVTRRSDVAVVRAFLTPEEIDRSRPFAITTPERTILDLSKRLSLVEAVVIADRALQLGLTTVDALAGYVLNLRGRKGVRRLRRVLELAEPRAESQMETRLRLLLGPGLPRPEAQVEITDSQGRFVARVDLLYRDEGLILEYDGATHRESLAEDLLRQNALFQLGYRMLRYTAADVYSRPQLIRSQVRSALVQGRTLSAAA